MILIRALICLILFIWLFELELSPQYHHGGIIIAGRKYECAG